VTNDVRVDAARSFEAGADAYERHRPRYPEQLFDDIRELAGTRWGARLLEIGAGTGRATLDLAVRGAEIDAIEPSRDMLDVLAARLASAASWIERRSVVMRSTLMSWFYASQPLRGVRSAARCVPCE